MNLGQPKICNTEAQERFRSSARQMSLDPDDPWVGGYVDYEWNHIRHVFENIGIVVSGRNIMEFGCNMGATSIILAVMGARVTGVDVNRDYVELAKLNAESYGLGEQIDFLYMPDTTQLPFQDGQFDLITCSSVLEYVPHGILKRVQREIDRVLKPGGLLRISATSNRIWPQEVHSRRWLINYMPRCLDRMLSPYTRRGVSPLRMRFGFGPGYRDLTLADGGAGYLRAKRRMGMEGAKMMLLQMAVRLLSPARISVGLLTTSISLFLRKEPEGCREIPPRI